MTTKQRTSKAAMLPAAAATAAAGTPRRRVILLASLVLVLLAGVVVAVTAALSPSAAPTAHGTSRPLTGTGTGTTTLNLRTGAATADFTGHLSPLGAETGHDDLTFTPTSASTFSYTGTRTFVAANGGKLFSAITGSGTFTRSTGRFAGASGTYKDTISSVVVSATATSQTSRFTAVAEGKISH